MRAIWADDEATFHGEFVNFDRIWSWPKPRQRPGPPVLVGGGGAKVLQRVVDYGDEWLPLHFDPLKLQARIAELQQLAEEAERGPIPVTLWHITAEPAPPETYSQAGLHRCAVPAAHAGTRTRPSAGSTPWRASCRTSPPTALWAARRDPGTGKYARSGGSGGQGFWSACAGQ